MVDSGCLFIFGMRCIKAFYQLLGYNSKEIEKLMGLPSLEHIDYVFKIRIQVLHNKQGIA